MDINSFIDMCQIMKYYSVSTSGVLTMNKVVYKDGIYDISNDEYHSSAAISRSQLLCFDKSPYHFWFQHLSGLAAPRETTPAMIIGQVFHTLLLEPDLFSKEYIVMPEVDRRTKEGKNQWQMFQDIAKGKTMLSVAQYEKALQMVDLVKKHEIVKTLTEESVFEQSIFWTDKESGIQFKARPDIWSEKMVVDLKTSRDSGEYSFTRSALKYGYYLQAGMLYEACKSVGKPFEMFVSLVVEKEEPFVPLAFIMNDKALQYGIDQFQIYKRKLKECLDENKWPAYPVKELGVPVYALNELEGEEI